MATLAERPELGSAQGFGKRIGDGTTEAISRLTEIGVGRSLETGLARTERALAKLDEGTYGTCDACGEAIPPKRLRAMPDSVLCVDVLGRRAPAARPAPALRVPARVHLREAALLGAATGMRTCSGVGALALRRRLGGPRVRLAIIASAAGELVIDKLPGVPPRIQPPQLAGRVGVGAFAGHRVAGPPGAAAGAAAALASAFVDLPRAEAAERAAAGSRSRGRRGRGRARARLRRAGDRARSAPR